MFGQPFLGLLDLRQGLAALGAFGVALHEAAVPVDPERFLDNAPRLVLAAQRRKVARRRLGDAHRVPLIGRQRAPEVVQPFRVMATLVEHRLHGKLLEPQRQHRVQRVALLQRARQPQDLRPVLQMLVRTQRNPLHVDLPPTL
ncbi:hypothetical protein D3C87_1368210 [compost metagenome]